MRRHMMKASGEKLPAWFKEHIVCWYSPVRQGCTNEDMAANPVLKDLSGKGYDATCYNFGWTTRSGIDANGCLQFDGEKDYAVCDKDFVLTDFTIIMQRAFENIDVNWPCTVAKYLPSQRSMAFEVKAPDKGAVFLYSFGKSSYPKANTKFDISTMTPTNYCGQSIERGSVVDSTATKLCIATSYVSSNAYMWVRLGAFLLFDVTLTDEQIQWVKTNLIDN